MNAVVSNSCSVELPEANAESAVPSKLLKDVAEVMSAELPEAGAEPGEVIFEAVAEVASAELPEAGAESGEFIFKAVSEVASAERPEASADLGVVIFEAVAEVASAELPEAGAKLGKDDELLGILDVFTSSAIKNSAHATQISFNDILSKPINDGLLA